MNPSTISPGIAKTVANDSYLPLEVLPSKTGSRGDRSTAANLHLPATRRARSQSPDSVSLLSNDDFSELRRIPSAFSNTDDPRDGGLLHGQGRSGVRGQLQTFWVRNKGLALVLLAQMFGTCMNIGTRLLENLGKGEDGEGGMHPFQIIFARMSMTTVLSVAYMAYTKTPDFPFGAKGIRLLLVARGTGGFFGVFGLYWSLQYLPIADATVLGFLAPVITCAVCARLLKEPYTRTEKIGGLVSLIGVILIARPTTLFGSDTLSPQDGQSFDPSDNTIGSTIATPTNSQRLAAVGMAMVGVFGGVVAYTTIRMIGLRAHPLISVNYLATWCTIVSGLMLLCIPSIPIIFPRNPTEWALLAVIGIGGFALQFLLTAGLRYEKSSRATNMVYSQMLFALCADRLIWGLVPGTWSLGGSALILSAAICIALQKDKTAGSERREDGGRGPRDEEVALVDGRDDMEMGEVRSDLPAARASMTGRRPASIEEAEVLVHNTRHDGV